MTTDDHSAARDGFEYELEQVLQGYFRAADDPDANQSTEHIMQAVRSVLDYHDYRIEYRRDPAAGRVCVSVETARSIKRELNRLSDHEQFEDADVAEQHRRELEDAITESAAPDPGSDEQGG